MDDRHQPPDAIRQDQQVWSWMDNVKIDLLRDDHM